MRVQPYLGFRSRERLRLTTRALRQPKRDFAPAGRIRTIRLLLGQFASRPVSKLAVRLRVEGPDATLLDVATLTDSDGYARFDVPLDPAWDLPEHPAWEAAQLCWNDRGANRTIEARILAPGHDGRLAVISDIDDTIIETGITGGWRSLVRNWRRIFAQLPGERLPAPGAAPFYGALGGGEVPPPGERRPDRHVAATHRPFFYVSSSPWNLFSYLVAYITARRLPLGPLLLRDWGLNRATFASASHGAHKRVAIASILAMYPDLRFVLIGDDTQGDLPAFAHAVATFPDRIAAVFVRTAAAEALNEEEVAALATLRAAATPLWLGTSFEAGQDFLATFGFTPGGETERLVKVVEKVVEDGAKA